MTFRYTATIVAALLSVTVTPTSAQGDPEALVAGTINNPTSSWQQWQPKPTYALEDLPQQYMGANRIPGGGEAQSGWNQCANDTWNQKSLCQTAYINDLQDWCIWGPPEGGDIGSTERVAVAYCTTKKHGTRLIPDGTITGAHFLQTPNYVQISGVGDFSSIGIPVGDSGGEMDSAGADDLGNPIGGVIFTTAIPGTNGVPTQVRHWTNFMSFDQFCLRACWGTDASDHCEHKLDTMGCRFNMPSLSGYTAGIFESCEGDNAPFQAVYDGSTFNQGDAVTPSAHPPASSSNCITTSSIRHGLLAASIAPSTTTTSSSLVTSTSSSVSTATSSDASLSSSASQTRTPVDNANNQDSAARVAALSPFCGSLILVLLVSTIGSLLL